MSRPPLAIVGLALLLSACAQPQPQPHRATLLPERHVDEVADLLWMASNALDTFVLEPRGSCRSAALHAALGAGLRIAELYESAGAIHEPLALATLHGVALAADDRGCPDLATALNDDLARRH